MVVQPGRMLRWLFPGVLWRGDKNHRSVYLTFDDGPIPEITPWVLDVLKQYGVKATFFCVGENVEKHREIYHQLIEQGHVVGNHTYNHINVWNHSTKDYFNNIDRAKPLIKSNLFRPPHGKIFPWHVRSLKKSFKSIVMWDVLSYDFDRNITSDVVYSNVVTHVRNGSLIVFHDSIKAWLHLQVVLPKTIEWLQKNNYQFKLIDNN